MSQQPQCTAYPPQNKKKKIPTWVWVVGICVAVIALIAILASAVAARSYDHSQASLPAGGQDYVAVLHVEGTMVSSSAPTGISGGEYDQDYLLDTLDMLTYDDKNKGLLLYIDSPGGEVMAASDLGDAVVAYKAATGRPVYAYGNNYAASGGYWLAAAADRFFANRYCITGSIGVTYGNMFDFSGLLEKYGVRVNTITSGDQKAMGNSWEEMTPETRAIFQSIIDEYYGYFISWVSEQRGLDLDQVRQLADGRIYTASQAVANGLADQVGGYEDCLSALLEASGPDLAVEEFAPAQKPYWMYLLGQSAAEREINSLRELLPPTGVLAYYGG